MKNSLLLAAAAVVLAACARTAPELPRDMSSVNAEETVSAEAFSAQDVALSCDEILVEQDRIREDASQYNQEIKKNRGKNQAAGYVAGVLFPPALLATVHNDAEKAELDALQQRFDTIQGLKRLKSCPSESA